MNRRIVITLASLYAAFAIMTFGHAAAFAQRAEDARMRACEARVAVKRDGVCWESGERVVMSGFMGGALWPLYWSWEAWS